MKNLLKTKRTSGFTIIEVMIVLAIAGLIMVIVFIAVPQLQRNQRDNTRQNTVNRLKAEIETYAGNNQGQYPFGGPNGTPANQNQNAIACGNNVTGCWANFFNNYVTGGRVQVNDPSTGQPIVTATVGAPRACTSDPCTNVAVPANRGAVEIVYGASCDGERLQRSPLGVNTSLTSRTFAIVVGLDRGGTRYCVDNG